MPSPRCLSEEIQPDLGDLNKPPPEPGFARREANYATVESQPAVTGPLPGSQPIRKQGGGTRGNQGFTREASRGRLSDLGVSVIAVTELLVPPLGLSALQGPLGLGDVGGELGLFAAEFLLELGEGTFDDNPPPLVESRSKNYLTMALEEIAEGKIKYTYKG